MKYLICFLLFSTAVLSQNYQYAIEVVPNKTVGSPTDFTISKVTETTVDLTWIAPVEATSIKDYEIYNKNVLLAKSTGTATNFQLKGLTSDTSYSLTVRAVYSEGSISKDSNIQEFKTLATTTGVNNLLEEIEYFKAYLLPITQKATIQQALDKYGSVRLEKGDYSGVNIIMKSNQRLYGHPSLSKVSNITIAAGSTGVVIEQLTLSDRTLTFEAGLPISNCILKTLRYVYVNAVGAKLENNELINIGGQIKFDCSASGYFRNNKIIKHQAQGISNQLVMKGNIITPSYGNVNFHSNYLTPAGDATDIDGLQSATFVGVDSEGWNLNGQGTKAMFTAKNIGDLKITDFGGGNEYSAVRTGAYDIDAQNLFFFNKYLKTSNDIISARTNMFLIEGEGGYKRGSGAVTGFDLHGNLDKTNSIKYNGIEQVSTITNATILSNLTSSILGAKHTPWMKFNWETLPDPLGANWKSNRVGKSDQRAYIQNLIDTKGIAELPEGIFYIGSTLKIPLDGNHGIIGQGTGKTVIVGLADDFPLLTLDNGTDSNFILANLTLQGGSVGIYAGKRNNVGIGQIAYQNLRFIIFRDQNYGIHLSQIMGLDNNFFEYLGFVNCNKGFYQEPLLPYAGDYMTSSYVDKTMYYRSQFINCDTGISMQATRPDNLNAWLDCKFDRGSTALNMGGQNYPIVANCDFSNFKGTNVITSNSISLYSSKFYNNTPSVSTLNSMITYIEGCIFLDNTNMFSPVIYNSTFSYILNSTITGNVVVSKPSNLYYDSSAIYVNSTFSANPTLSKLLVNIKVGVPTIIINSTPNPYPRFLVTE